LIILHIDDLTEVGKPIRRSKRAVMDALKVCLGRVKIQDLTRERLIEFGRKRAKQGAGPPTLAIDFSFIRTVLSHAAAVYGIEVSAENVRLARIALKHLNLIGRSNERDRRPTQDELDLLTEYTEANPRGEDKERRHYEINLQGQIGIEYWQSHRRFPEERRRRNRIGRDKDVHA
jgi:hypothetical protein